MTLRDRCPLFVVVHCSFLLLVVVADDDIACRAGAFDNAAAGSSMLQVHDALTGKTALQQDEHEDESIDIGHHRTRGRWYNRRQVSCRRRITHRRRRVASCTVLSAGASHNCDPANGHDCQNECHDSALCKTDTWPCGDKLCKDCTWKAMCGVRSGRANGTCYCSTRHR